MKENLESILSMHLFKIKDFDLTVADLFIVIIILTVTYGLILLINKVISRRLYRSGKIDVGRFYALKTITRYILWTIGIVTAMQSIGLDITILLAGSAALLVGIGLGIQQIFLDFVSGLFILLEGAIKVGDIVQVSDLTGRVLQINFRTTVVRTIDNIEIIVPNSKFVNDNVVNWSRIEKLTRFRVSVGVAYGSDVEKVRKALLECAHEHPQVLQDPKPMVQFMDFGNSSLDFDLVFWTHEIFPIINVKSDIRYLIDAKFREYGVTIPFPQRDLHIKSVEAGFTVNRGQGSSDPE